jgi:hypothetical protein
MAQNRWSSRIFRGCGWMLVVPVAASMVAVAAQGQATAPTAADVPTPQDIVTALHQMEDKASVIFVGRVTGVTWSVSGNVAATVVETRFEVEQAVRGCSEGVYVLREWAGLWEGDNQRYRAGQHLLMMLHAPNAAGLSSPVDGMDGAIPIVRGGSAALGANSSARRAPPAVDLRWVGTKLLRPVSYANAATQAVGLPARAVVQGSAISIAPATALSSSASPGSASVPAQQASVDVVVGMLTSWQKVEHAIR